jgi:hypothetical protein
MYQNSEGMNDVDNRVVRETHRMEHLFVVTRPISTDDYFSSRTCQFVLYCYQMLIMDVPILSCLSETSKALL